jgi:hypothetical protein
MAKQLDVYRDWLGISETERPLNYYQLLKLKKFEDDSEKIRSGYRKLNAHVRKYQTGEFGPQSQQLLNELAKAMLCLTDAQRKSDYDASVGRVRTGEGKRPTFEQILLSRKMVTPDQLNRVRGYADAVGLPIRDAMLQQKAITPEAVMQAYAESEGMPYVDLTETGVDETLVLHIPAPMARNFSCVPVMVDDGQMLIASPNPLNPDMEEHLRHRVGMPVRSVFCTPSGVNGAIDKYYSREALQAAAAAAKQAQAEGKPLTGTATLPPHTAKVKGLKTTKPAAETGSEAAPAGPQSTKRKLMIAWVVFVALMILYFGYKFIKAW